MLKKMPQKCIFDFQSWFLLLLEWGGGGEAAPLVELFGGALAEAECQSVLGSSTRAGLLL